MGICIILNTVCGHIMSDQPPYKFLDKDKDGLAVSNFGGGFAVVDLSGNLIIQLNTAYRQHHHLVYGMELRESDVWIITPPKCGTTWTQETTWHIMNRMQLERTKEFLFDRSPMVDMPCITDMSYEDATAFFKNLDDLPSPRTIKTHFPLQLLPPKLLDTCKVIFVSRNIKDACVSSYHFIRSMKKVDFDGDFQSFANTFRYS